MKKVAVIGAGISGLTIANLLKDKYIVKVYEKESIPGGLISCKEINGGLFHTCGGHVFNSKRQDVLNWFWSFFDREAEFTKVPRNSIIFMEDGTKLPYPIENYAYLFDEKMKISFIEDLIFLAKTQKCESANFEDFLLNRFGKTLYQNYFKPYNEKVWRRDLSKIPLSWLEGKLPMPRLEEIIYNNIDHVREKQFVHSSFWYEKNNGSQFVAERFAKDLTIEYGKNIQKIERKKGSWIVEGEMFDYIVYCGNIKNIPFVLEGEGVDLSDYVLQLDSLEYHGTTSVFCEIESNPYSWIYMPSRLHQSHRIICTGNFSENNNPSGKLTATIEFTDEISLEDIHDNLSRIPLKPKYITHHYTPCSYPIQDADTRQMIKDLKTDLSKLNFYFSGRFADWEYYNMDVAIGAAMDLVANSFD